MKTDQNPVEYQHAVTGLLETKKHGTDDFNIGVYDSRDENNPRGMYMHWHHEYEIIFIESGNFIFIVDGEEIKASDNQVVFINRYVIHSCTFYNPESLFTCIVYGEKLLFSEHMDMIYQKYIRQIALNTKKPPSLITDEYDWGKDIINHVKTLLYSWFSASQAYEINVKIQLLSIYYEIIKNNLLSDAVNNNDGIADIFNSPPSNQ